MSIGKIVIVGPGAVGSSIAAWISGTGREVFCHGRPASMDIIERKGIRHYRGAEGVESAVTTRPRVLRSLEGLGEEDLLVFCTKNMDLDSAAREASEATGARPFALSLANGIDNQEILSLHFPNRGYGVIGFNAWMDEAGLVGWQTRGPLVLGMPDNDISPKLFEIAAALNPAVPTSVTTRFGDATHSKLVVNLANTVATLVGLGYRRIDDIASLQRLMSMTLGEGVRVVTAAGYREHRVGTMPGFRLIRLMGTIPPFLSKGMFRKNLAKMVKSSMSQDVIQRGRHETELESLTGYIVRLAARVGVKASCNERLYHIARERFAMPVFEPMEPGQLLAIVEER